MGKFRREKKKASSNQQADLPSTIVGEGAPLKVGQEGTDIQLTSTDPIPILTKLTSVEVNDRAWAASAIGNLLNETNSRQLLIKNNVVGQLGAAILGIYIIRIVGVGYFNSYSIDKYGQ